VSFRVHLPKPARRVIYDALPDKEAKLRLLKRLRAALSDPPQAIRGNRLDLYPEYFRWRTVIVHEGTWHIFTFHVNDQRAPGHLFVEGVIHETRPAPE
jgi:hypothetical protein